MGKAQLSASKYDTEGISIVVQFMNHTEQLNSYNYRYAHFDMNQLHTYSGSIHKFLIYSQNADFNWNSREEGLILGAFSIGCAFAFLSGFIVRRFGGARIIGINAIISAILVILTPFLVRIHLYAFIFDRVLLGLFAEVYRLSLQWPYNISLSSYMMNLIYLEAYFRYHF